MIPELQKQANEILKEKSYAAAPGTIIPYHMDDETWPAHSLDMFEIVASIGLGLCLILIGFEFRGIL